MDQLHVERRSKARDDTGETGQDSQVVPDFPGKPSGGTFTVEALIGPIARKNKNAKNALFNFEQYNERSSESTKDVKAVWSMVRTMGLGESPGLQPNLDPSAVRRLADYHATGLGLRMVGRIERRRHGDPGQPELCHYFLDEAAVRAYLAACATTRAAS